MDLSVIIPTYNRSNVLSNTLRSIIAQVCDFSFEVFVCDDGSNDNTRDVVEYYRNRASFPIHYLKQERFSARYSTARNLGIKTSCGRITVLIDDDMILSPYILKAHYDTHKSSGVVTIGYRYNLIPNEPEHFLPDTRDKYFTTYPYTEVPIWSIMEACNISLERELLLTAGIFDENFIGWGGEDIELGYRLCKLGAKLVLNRDIFGWHQYDFDPKNSFLRYSQGLKPDFSSQVSNLTRFKNKFPGDPALEKFLSDWILNLQKMEIEMNM